MWWWWWWVVVTTGGCRVLRQGGGGGDHPVRDPAAVPLTHHDWSCHWAVRLEVDVCLYEVLQVPDDLLYVVRAAVCCLVRGEVADEVVKADLRVAAVREGTDEGTSGQAGEGRYEGGKVCKAATLTQETRHHHHWAVGSRLTPS